MTDYVLTLYVTGHSANSLRAVANLSQIMDDYLAGQGSFTVIDVLEQPQLAEQAKILATPTLIKHSPPPVRRIVGDLSDREKVVQALGL